MQAIGADDKVKGARAGVSELHPDIVRPLFEADDLVAKQDFRLAPDRVEQEPGKIGARQGYEPPASQLAEHARPEPGYALAPPVYDPHLAHAVADAPEIVREPHALGDVVAEAPKIDDIAASRKPGACSTSVVVNPAALSQKASVGPAIPTPEIRTVVTHMPSPYRSGPAEL